MNPFIGLAHVCISTRDLKKSVDFYTKALNFEVFHTEILNASEKPVDIFPAKFALLRLGDLYLEILEPMGPSASNFLHTNVVGTINHFGISVRDIDQAVEHMKKYITDQPLRITTNSTHFKGKTYRNVGLAGPDGESIALYEMINEEFFK